MHCEGKGVLDNKAVGTFIRKKSVLANRARHYIYYDGKCLCYKSQIQDLLGWVLSLLTGTDTTFTRMGSVLANRAGHSIY